MSEILENIDELVDVSEKVDESVDISVEIPQRVNPFCVISKCVYGEYAIHDIQTNSSWGSNPYPEEYAVVPDEMVKAILETKGFCDIVLNEDGTEVVEFTAREIPEIPTEEVTSKPTANDIINAMLGLEG